MKPILKGLVRNQEFSFQNVLTLNPVLPKLKAATFEWKSGLAESRTMLLPSLENPQPIVSKRKFFIQIFLLVIFTNPKKLLNRQDPHFHFKLET